MTHSAELQRSRRAALFTSGNPAGRGPGGGGRRRPGRRPPPRSPPRSAGAAALAPGARQLTPSRCASAPEWLPRAVNGHRRLVKPGQSNCGVAAAPLALGNVRPGGGGGAGGAPWARGGRALTTDPGNVPDAFVHFLVNVLHSKRKGNAVYHLEMLAVYRSLWIFLG